jgi:O-antigen/teichoic acid export membrane protein
MIELKKIKEVIDNKNDREVFINVGMSFLIKGFALLIQVFTLPAYLRFFDNHNVLGVWYTLLSVITWIFTFDLGIGNGLRNKLVEAIHKEDKSEIQTTISSAYISIGGLLVILFLFFVSTNQYINWNTMLNIDQNFLSEKSLRLAINITLLGVFFQFILKTITSILYALQLAFVNNFLALITSTTQLIFVLLAPDKGINDNFVNMSIAHALCVNIPLLLTTYVVFKRSTIKGCYPKFSSFDKSKAFNILKLGGTFLWAQIMFMILVSTNEYLITYFTNPENVVTYQIYNRLFTIVGSLSALALTPIWSAITKSVVQKNYMWMKKTYKRLHYGVLLTIILEFLVVIASQVIINFWLGENSIQVDYLTATIFALYGSVYIWQTAESTIACGTGRMRVQTITYTICVLVKIILSVAVLKATGQWIYLIVINIIVLLSYNVIQYYFTKRDFKNLYI